MDSKELGKLIAARYGSKSAFAKKIDMPYSSLTSALERGIANTTVSVACKIAAGLGVSLDELVGGGRPEPFDRAEARRLYDCYKAAPEVQAAVDKLLNYKKKRSP